MEVVSTPINFLFLDLKFIILLLISKLLFVVDYPFDLKFYRELDID